MKKRFLTGLLALTLMLGCNSNVYGATIKYASNFTGSSIQLIATSENYVDIIPCHEHTVTLNVQCFNQSYSQQKIETVERVYSHFWKNKAQTSLVPSSIYDDSTYVGRYFKGYQKCIMTTGDYTYTWTKQI